MTNHEFFNAGFFLGLGYYVAKLVNSLFGAILAVTSDMLK